MIEICPEKVRLIPPSDSISTEKLSHGGTITTDTCNGAQKLRRIIVEKVGGMFEFDCMNHLRNVWFGGVEKALTKDMNVYLRSSLEDIDPKLRVSASMSAIIRAVDKEFSLSTNYPKGHGKLFLEWM